MTEKNTYFIDPHDETELARLQLQDNLFNEVIDMLPRQFVLRSNARARILDLACGPGGWALQVAQAYPEIAVVGVDISPPMITYARAQAEAREVTAQFRIMDILRYPWDLPDQYFDLVNARFIGGLTPVASLDSLLQECRRVLRPKGIFRNTEAVFMNAPTSVATHKLMGIVYAAMQKAGLSYSPYDIAANALIAHLLTTKLGFKDITLTPYVIDVSSKAPMHEPIAQDLKISTGLLRPFITRMGICSAEEFDRLLEDYVHELDDSNFCAHWFFCSLSATLDDRVG